MTDAWGIVVAGGRGDRFGGPKQLELLGGEPLWEWARRSLIEGGVSTVVVVGAMDGAVDPGERRRDSVAAGLAEVPDGVEYVLVHDAARPLATPTLTERVLARLRQGDVAGVIPGNAVRDATKRVEGERVVAAVDRDDLVTVQTPQGFVAAVLRRAHATVEGDAADDAELVAGLDEPVVYVEGEITNLKVTVPADLRLVEAIHAS
ncbi:MAG: NTP transferase domain-containing protein [Acidimicrobiia bacterium]|nr:2-C-methyl-D-erythritol 4-phosphate cytidylyltransferase [Acidimicrobiia bacterium]MBT8192648.1 2-C-methyl-D-erythritol 4-phosphate cytidylyltransferase [Acidimicrobiia bacterium]NNF88699.1 NTP transferase domain-containing protein [Acidimicrobiia bacterium]NNJ48500.1 NTP transferase domain-containing protein [Acidimicrobiia bacterium]NNL13749.1 NTP transferase domain-containing protein [Acidimicrobiia bacterium]